MTPTILSIAILLVAVNVALFICFDKKRGGWHGAAYDGHDAASRAEPRDRHAQSRANQGHPEGGAATLQEVAA